MHKSGKELFENLKCSLCQKYLTVGPIYSITQTGEKYKCGRCEDIRSTILIRNFCYENIVSNIDLPCSYAECNTTLQWGQVVEHEQTCNYRTIQCIGCDAFVKLDELEEHFKSDLSPDDNRLFKNVIENYSLPSQPKSATFLLKTNSHKYIIIIHFDCIRNMYAAVYCLQNLLEQTSFELKLTSESESTIVTFKGNVIEYTEKQHCINCTLQKCQLEYHVHSKKYKGNACRIVNNTSSNYYGHSTQCQKKCCRNNYNDYDKGDNCYKCTSKFNEVNNKFQIKVDFDLIFRLFLKPKNIMYSLHIFEPTMI